MQKFRLETTIAGSRFISGCAAALSRLNKGDEVRVIRDHHNRHDDKAVAVYGGIFHIGYVPRAVNGPLADLLDGGGSVRATVSVDPIIYGDSIKSPPKILIEED